MRNGEREQDVVTRPSLPGKRSSCATRPQHAISRYEAMSAQPTILLHAGTPKTGTTSLQRYLFAERANLRRYRTLYPADVSAQHPFDASAVPKHQWLIAQLQSSKPQGLLNRIGGIVATEAEGCDRVILSTEGLFNHWADIPPVGLTTLRALRDRYRVELCVWFRDPSAYVRSYYCQVLKNPAGPHPLYGRDLTVDDLLDSAWFQRQLQYDRYIDEATQVLGRGTVQAFAYSDDTVASFCEFYCLPTPALTSPRANEGLSIAAVAALRALNRRHLAVSTREIMAGEIVRADRQTDVQPFTLSGAEISRVRALTDHMVAALRERFGIVLTAA